MPACCVPAPVRAPKLPEDAPAFVRPVYDGFCFLLQCKWLIKAWKTPFTWKFASHWTGQSEHFVQKAMKWLLAHGLLVMAGIEQDLTCFLLGTKALMRRLGHSVGDALKRTQAEIIDTVQPVREILWADNASPPCPDCGRTRSDPNACPQCLRMANAKLHRTWQEARRAREGPLWQEESP